MSWTYPATCAAFGQEVAPPRYDDSLGWLQGAFPQSATVDLSFTFAADTDYVNNRSYVTLFDDTPGSVTGTFAPWQHIDVSFLNPGDPPTEYNGGDGWTADVPGQRGEWDTLPVPPAGVRSDTAGPNVNVLINDGLQHTFEIAAAAAAPYHYQDVIGPNDFWLILWNITQSIDGAVALTSTNVLTDIVPWTIVPPDAFVDTVQLSSVFAWVDDVQMIVASGTMFNDFEGGVFTPYTEDVTPGSVAPAFVINCPPFPPPTPGPGPRPGCTRCGSGLGGMSMRQP